MISQTKPARRARRAVAMLLLSSLALTGCHRSAELRTPAPQPDTRVVVRLSAVGAEEMAAVIGPEVVGAEGTVVEARPDEWVLSVLRVDRRRTSDRWNGEHVVFPQHYLRDVRERELDPVRTGLFSAAVVTVVTSLAVSFIRYQGRNSDNGGGRVDPPQ